MSDYRPEEENQAAHQIVVCFWGSVEIEALYHPVATSQQEETQNGTNSMLAKLVVQLFASAQISISLD